MNFKAAFRDLLFNLTQKSNEIESVNEYRNVFYPDLYSMQNFTRRIYVLDFLSLAAMWWAYIGELILLPY